MNRKNDDKIRMRCTGCGKRVKFPADMRGVAFRCPKCHTTLVTPLTLEELEAEQPASAPDAAGAALAPRRVPPPRPPRPSAEAPAPPAAAPRKKRVPAWHRLHVFLVRQQQRLCKRAARVLANPDMDEGRKRAELVTLRRERAVGIRQFSDKLFAELDREIRELREGPTAETDTGRRQIALIERERQALRLFLEVMFQRKTVAQDEGLRPARPGTREGAAEPPSKPASPDARTPES